MRTAHRLFCGALLVSSCIGAANAASTDPLLSLSDLTYVGSFRVPAGQFGDDANAIFDYGDDGLAFDAALHGLYIKSHVYGQLVAEISIPTPVLMVGESLATLPTATVLQDFADITRGHLDDEGIGNGVRLGGLMPYGDRLIGSLYGYYDAANEQTLTHFTAGFDLTVASFHGLYRVGPPDVSPRMRGGYMTVIPAAWQTALGGPALTGHGGGNIIGGSSVGPSAWAFDPAQLGVADPVPAKGLVYYPLDHSTLGTWGGGPTGAANPVLNGCSSFTGIVFAPGTRTVLFFGATGLGKQGYGEGTSDPALDGQPVPGSGTVYCYDPAVGSKGYHAYPYSAYVWAYDANDLALAAAGTKQPWEVVPYASGTLALPIDSGENRLNGAALDPATGLIYIAQAGGDTVEPYSNKPLIHVFQLPAAGTTTGGGTTGGTTGSSTGGSGGSTGGSSGTSGGGTGGTGGAGDDGGGRKCGIGTGWGLAALMLVGSLRQLRRRSIAGRVG